MKNGWKSRRRSVLILSLDEFESLIHEEWDEAEISFDYDGLDITYYPNDEDDALLEASLKKWTGDEYGKEGEMIRKYLSECIGADVTSFHTDNCDEVGVWICFSDTAYIDTAAGLISSELYNDGCAAGCHVILNGEIVAAVDVLVDGTVRTLAYKKDEDEPTILNF